MFKQMPCDRFIEAEGVLVWRSILVTMRTSPAVPKLAVRIDIMGRSERNNSLE
jgi:hypothetical protein